MNERNIMSYGNFYGNKDDLSKTTQCLKELRYDQTKTNILDKNMYQDPYDALFYALYSYKMYSGIKIMLLWKKAYSHLLYNKQVQYIIE